MRLSQRHKNLLRKHRYSAVYAIGPAEPVYFSTTAQAEALDAFLQEPRLGHNYQPPFEEFVTSAHPVRLGYTSDPAQAMVTAGDGWSFQWEYRLLGRVWFPGKASAEILLRYLHEHHPGMRKSWINLTAYPGREMFDWELKMVGKDLGLEGLDDVDLMDKLQEYENKLIDAITEAVKR